MNIDIAVKKVRELTEDELGRYAQLCEVEVVEYKRSIEHFTPEQMKRYGIPHIQELRDKKATFLYELKQRQENAKSKGKL